MKNTELLQEQSNAEQQVDRQNSGKLIDIEEVERTPFTIVTVNESEGEPQSFIAIGRNRLTEKQSYEACKKQIDERGWELTMQTMVYLVDRMFREIKELGDEWTGVASKEVYEKEKEEKATE